MKRLTESITADVRRAEVHARCALWYAFGEHDAYNLWEAPEKARAVQYKPPGS